jgi:hypothetical protein
MVTNPSVRAEEAGPGGVVGLGWRGLGWRGGGSPLGSSSQRQRAGIAPPCSGTGAPCKGLLSAGWGLHPHSWEVLILRLVGHWGLLRPEDDRWCCSAPPGLCPTKTLERGGDLRRPGRAEALRGDTGTAPDMGFKHERKAWSVSGSVAGKQSCKQMTSKHPATGSH